jgi:hypothetical protein
MALAPTFLIRMRETDAILGKRQNASIEPDLRRVLTD